MASLATPLLLFTWTILIVTKVFIYVIAFINTPGFFCVPVLLKMLLSFIIFQFAVDEFKKKQSHEKFIYILICFLLPASLPSKNMKTMKKLNIINFLLYFLECTGVLAFSVLMKHFYHNKLYCTFYEEVPQILGVSSVVTSFELLLVLMFTLIVFVTLLSGFLLWLYAVYLHPRTKLFVRVPKKGKALDGIINKAMDIGQTTMPDREPGTSNTDEDVSSIGAYFKPGLENDQVSEIKGLKLKVENLENDVKAQFREIQAKIEDQDFKLKEQEDNCRRNATKPLKKVPEHCDHMVKNKKGLEYITNRHRDPKAFTHEQEADVTEDPLALVWIPRKGYLCPKCDFKTQEFGGRPAQMQQMKKHIEDMHYKKSEENFGMSLS